jgi:hypothetical protein
MRAALAAIQRARQAERLYLRGRSANVVVDLSHVRLAGDRSEASGSRRAAVAAPPGGRDAIAARFHRAVGRLGVDPAAAIDSLLLLRLDALESAPGFAAALARATQSLRGGADATSELLRARAALPGETRSLPYLPSWESLR